MSCEPTFYVILQKWNFILTIAFIYTDKRIFKSRRLVGTNKIFENFDWNNAAIELNCSNVIVDVDTFIYFQAQNFRLKTSQLIICAIYSNFDLIYS